MTREDIPMAYALSGEQKWPHRAEDWEFLLGLGEGFVAVRAGQVIGTTMIWRFGAQWATLGMVIVSNHAQGQGVGRLLMEAALAALGDSNIMLHATQEGLPLYEKLGFRTVDTVYQHQATHFQTPLVELGADARVRPLGVKDREPLIALYNRATGMDRGALLTRLKRSARGVVLSHKDEAVGFAMVRRFGRGYAVGPVIAPDGDGARALVAHWLGKQSGKFCRLDVTGASGLSPWLADMGLPCVGEVQRMVRGTLPQEASDVRLFALVSQALG